MSRHLYSIGLQGIAADLILHPDQRFWTAIRTIYKNRILAYFIQQYSGSWDESSFSVKIKGDPLPELEEMRSAQRRLNDVHEQIKAQIPDGLREDVKQAVEKSKPRLSMTKIFF